MPKNIPLPKLGVNMTEAVIVKWLVSPGQKVREGDALVEAETDKATQEIPANMAGIVAELLAEEGDTVQCGEPLLALVDEGEEYASSAPQGVAAPTPSPAPVSTPQVLAAPAFAPSPTPQIISAPAAPQATASAYAPPASEPPRQRISPFAKKTARELGVDCAQVRPAVAGERIVSKDVMDYAAAKTPEPRAAELDTPVPLSAIRKTIAARMALSHDEIPSAALFMTVDATAYLSIKEAYKAKHIKVSVDAYAARMAAKALEAHPDVNAAWENGAITRRGGVHIGIAVDAPKGLVVPVVRDANRKGLAQISNEIYKLADAVKQGKPDPDTLFGSTFTITNLGSFGVERFVPIINPPECCILGIGAIRKIFVPDENDNPVLQSAMTLCLVHDHRIIDGAPAARFLRDLKDLLENPLMGL